MEKKLYPFRFAPVVREKDWGRETTLIADLGETDSEALEGWLAGNTLSELMQICLERLVGETSFEFYGTQFPIAVRLLDIRPGGRVSLRLNPDDETARLRYDAFGRTALWYVVEAGEDAVVWTGFRKETSAEDFYRCCIDGSVEELLHATKPRPGDVFRIDPGVVHAAAGKLRIVEIAEASDLFFRIHDWGAGKELHLEEAFDLVDFRPWEKSLLTRTGGGKEATQKLVGIPQMEVSLFRLANPVHVFQEESESFLLYTCVAGSALLQLPSTGDQTQYTLHAGEALLVPEEVEEFFLIPSGQDTQLLETMIPRHG